MDTTVVSGPLDEALRGLKANFDGEIVVGGGMEL